MMRSETYRHLMPGSQVVEPAIAPTPALLPPLLPRQGVEAQQGVVGAGGVVAGGGPPQGRPGGLLAVGEVPGGILQGLGQTQVLVVCQVRVLAHVPTPGLAHLEDRLQLGVDEGGQGHRAGGPGGGQRLLLNLQTSLLTMVFE